MKGGFTILKNSKILILHLVRKRREFPGSPVVRTPGFYCWGPRFDPWLGYLLQYSCLENPMDRGAWQATVLGATRSLKLHNALGNECSTSRTAWPKKETGENPHIISTKGEKAQLRCSNKQPRISVTSKSWSSCLNDAMSQVRWVGDWCGLHLKLHSLWEPGWSKFHHPEHHACPELRTYEVTSSSSTLYPRCDWHASSLLTMTQARHMVPHNFKGTGKGNSLSARK